MNILILDDEPKIRNGMVRLINESFSQRHALFSFGDALEALKFLAGNHVDLLITDIKMPDLSGLELIQELQGSGKQLEVVILSGYSEFSFAQKAIDLKVKKYLTKPTDPLEIIRLIEEVEKKLSVEADRLNQAYSGGNVNVIRCLDYISRNFSKKFTLTDMAEELYISPTYLCKLFKKETSLNLNEYITGFRIEKAKKLLTDYKLTVNQVADQVGYKDATYFSSVFKKLTGQTPHEYRAHPVGPPADEK